MMIVSNDYGKLGEELACKYLKKQKYKIVCRNYKNSVGEIDIVAVETCASRKRTDDYKKMSPAIKKEDVLCFVEVKSRHSTKFGNPSDAVDYQKQRKYINIAPMFMMANKNLDKMQYRFDIIEVVGDKVSSHIKNAF